jgi:hypothetical protein
MRDASFPYDGFLAGTMQLNGENGKEDRRPRLSWQTGDPPVLRPHQTVCLTAGGTPACPDRRGRLSSDTSRPRRLHRSGLEGVMHFQRQASVRIACGCLRLPAAVCGSPTPTALHPSAQGWRDAGAPTLGECDESETTSTRLWPCPCADGVKTNGPQPRCGWECLRMMTQGSSCLATLGWRLERRWRSFAPQQSFPLKSA